MPEPPPSAAWNGASGVHLGDVLIEGDDILGDGVNIAARLEGIAEPGGICISEDAFRQVRSKVEARHHERAVKIAVRTLRMMGDVQRAH